MAEQLGDIQQSEVFLSVWEEALMKKEEAFKQKVQASEEAFQKKVQASEEAFQKKVQASEEAFKRREDALGEQEKQLATQRSHLVKESDKFTTAKQSLVRCLQRDVDLVNNIQSTLAELSQVGRQFINSLTTPEATQPPQHYVVRTTPVVQPPTPEARQAEKEKRHRERKEERKRAKLNKNLIDWLKPKRPKRPK